MQRIKVNINHYYNWWTTTLLSCLPYAVESYLKGKNKDVDLIIAHYGENIVVQNNKGKLIDSISINADNQDSVITLGTGKAVLIEDSSINFEENLIGAPNDDSDDELEFILDPESIRSDNYNDITLAQIEDQVTNWATSSSDAVEDDDTIIILGDQGKSLQINSDDSDDTEAEDRTVIFQNDKGKIRSVDSQKIRSVDSQSNSLSEKHTPEFVLDNEQVEIDRSEDNFHDYQIVSYLLEKYQYKKKCIYLLPYGRVFSKRLSYPLEAIQNIESVLRYDLEKHIPLSFKDVRYFYVLNVDHVNNKVDVEVAVIKSMELEVMSNILETHIKQGLLCTTKRFYQKYGRKVNFAELTTTFWQKVFNRKSTFMMLNASLLLLLFITPYFLYNQYNNSLEIDSTTDMSRVQNIISTVNTINDEANYASKLSRTTKNTPKLIEILALLSAEIQKNAWITKFSYKNNEIRLKVEAVSATSVLDRLNKVEIFESVKFVSSIVKDQRNQKENFDLLLRVKSGV